MSTRKRPYSSKRQAAKKLRILRSGKWTYEEELYANRLIEDFENGLLDDCEDGCTLRAYLAQKLRCAPMRISKKFAGRCIGKLVFVRRQRKPGTFSEGPSLKELEHEFYCSVHVVDDHYHAASTTSESGSEDGYDDYKHADCADSDVEYTIPTSSHPLYPSMAAPSSFRKPFVQEFADHDYVFKSTNSTVLIHQNLDYAVSSSSSAPMYFGDGDFPLDNILSEVDFLDDLNFDNIF